MRRSSGEVTEANPAIADDPSLINRDPEGEGWFFKLKLSDPAELEGLMDEAAYREWVEDALSLAPASTSKWDAARLCPRRRRSSPSLARRRSICSTRSRARRSSTSAAARAR